MVNRKNKNKVKEVPSSHVDTDSEVSVSSGAEYDNGYGTPVKPRKRFTLEETRILEDHFRKNTRPTAEVKKKLANDFDTVPNRIQIWFQNRRAKEKKVSTPAAAQDSEVSSPASEKADDISEVEDAQEEGSKGNKRRQVNSDQALHYRPSFPFFGPIMGSNTTDNWPPRGIDPRAIFPNPNTAMYSSMYPDSYMGRPYMFENNTVPVAPITSEVTRILEHQHEKEEGEECLPVKKGDFHFLV